MDRFEPDENTGAACATPGRLVTGPAEPPVLSVLPSHLSGRSPFWVSMNLGAYAADLLDGRVCLVDLDLNRYVETLLPRALNGSCGLDRVLDSDVNLFRHDEAAWAHLDAWCTTMPGVAAHLVPAPSLGDLRVDSGVFTDRWQRVLDAYRWAIRTARSAGMLVVVMPPENPKLLAMWVANRLSAADGPYGPADHARLPQAAHDLAAELTEDLWELAATESTCAMYVVEDNSRHLQPLTEQGDRWRPERGGWILACSTSCDHHGHDALAQSLGYDLPFAREPRTAGEEVAPDAVATTPGEVVAQFSALGGVRYPADREQRPDSVPWGAAHDRDALEVRSMLDHILREATASTRLSSAQSWWEAALSMREAQTPGTDHINIAEEPDTGTGSRSRWWRRKN